MAVVELENTLHGWFLVERLPEDLTLRFFRYAVALGADPATWSRCHFVRMPMGFTETGEHQPVFYFNPDPLETRWI